MAKYSIKEFFKGKTSSPYTTDGVFWKSQNLDIHGQEGLARINYKPVGHTGSGGNAGGEVTGRITSFAPLSGTGGAAVFADGYAKRISLSTTTGAISGTSAIGSSLLTSQYVANWKGYILSINTTTLSAMAISAGMDGAWTSVSTGFDNMTMHKMLVSLMNDKVYICNNNKVAVLEENTGETFNPATGSTFTLTLDALKLNSGYQIESLEDFGRFIAIFVNIKSQGRTGIFLWDRAATTLDDMFEIKEPRMTRTLEHQGTIYITGGKQGNIYSLTESGLRKLAQIKIGDYDNNNYIAGMEEFETLQFSTMAIWKDRLMVGVSPVGSIESAGIYSVVDRKVNHEFNITTGNTNNKVSIGSLLSLQTQYYNHLLFGINDADESPSLFSLQSVQDRNNRWDDYAAYFETPLLRAGHKLKTNSIKRIEVLLGRNLQTGEGVRLKYRRNLDDSYTTLDTQDFANQGAVSSLYFPGIVGIQNIQLRCELTTGASSKNTPYIYEINLF